MESEELPEETRWNPNAALDLLCCSVDNYWHARNTGNDGADALNYWADEAREAASDLVEWMEAGGFEPDNLNGALTHLGESGGFDSARSSLVKAAARGAKVRADTGRALA